MKNKILLFFLIILCSKFSLHGQNQKTFTAADYDKAVAMLDGNVTQYIDHMIWPQWLPDNRLWYKSRQAEKVTFKLVHPKSGKKIVANTKKELFEKAAVEPIAKRTNVDQLMSPDGKYVAFIKDWNLWMKAMATGEETALTTDGLEHFGYATDNAGWRKSDRPILSWSPDSKKIATFRQDQRHVSNMYLVRTKVGAPELQEWKYPLPGDSTIIQIYRVIINIEPAPKIIPLKMGPDDRRGTLCDDISCEGGFDDIAWSSDSKQLVFVSTSRDHKSAKVRMANTETGDVREVFKEEVATQYESGRGAINWRYLSKTNEIIWYSQRSDWGHLYLYNASTGKVKNQITTGNFLVRKVVKVDAENRVIYFVGSGKELDDHPYYQYLFRVDFDGNNFSLLTPEKGDHTIRFSPDGNYFTDTYSQPNVPPVYKVRDTKGRQITMLEKADISRLETTGWKPPQPFSVKSADNRWDLHGLLFTPSMLDTTQKYPVIVYIYPGPQGGSIRSWSFNPARRDNQALAELGFVVMALEGSCNPGRSKSFHDACYGNMGENTLPDQVSGLTQLADKYSFMDLSRVGIWGHSGGGFAAATAMFKYPDIFKVGIAESGNHDNRNYEDDWGERYIGLETFDSNGLSNYAWQANQQFAHQLKGKLLLVHGGLDDNVPPYNSYLVADALIKANKDFDFLLLPNAGHGYGADGYYVMRRRWDYFVTHLLQGIPPKSYQIKIGSSTRGKT